MPGGIGTEKVFFMVDTARQAAAHQRMKKCIPTGKTRCWIKTVTWPRA